MKVDAKQKQLRWGDGLIYGVLLALCALLFVLPHLRHTGHLEAQLIADGELIETIDLQSLKTEITRSVNGCVIRFSKDGVQVLSATCPDKLCVHAGALHTVGDSVACVPNRVAVTLKEAKTQKNPYDVVAY